MPRGEIVGKLAKVNSWMFSLMIMLHMVKVYHNRDRVLICQIKEIIEV